MPISQDDAERIARIAGRGMRIFTLAFLSFWLIGWSAGILFAIGAVLSSDQPAGEFFLMFWILGASVGWVFAVRQWWKTLRGK